uniref:Arrestin domain containing 3 n=1 Tax=Petromyzon marinus TaxID=7757 RepID=S4R9X8_PETMA
PLATSFEGRHGWVRYWVEAALERDWGRTQRTRHRFSVVVHVDINTPTLQESAAGAREKNVGFAMFGSSLIALSVKIDRRGYCPGEAIAIHAEVENCSSRLVVPKAALCQRQVFLAGGRTRSHVRAVAEVRGESVPSGRTDSWDGRLLKVPRLPPSVLSCALIRVEYCLQVYVDIPGSSNLQLELPLVLGTIPLQALGSRTSSVSSQRSVTGGPAWSELPEAPEAPPCYTDVVSEERFRSLCVHAEEASAGPRSAYLYMQQFMLQPPPLYSEVDPHPLERLPVQQKCSFLLLP